MTEIVIQIPPEVEPYEQDIRRFVDAMVFKLKIHHRKGRWEGKTMNEYLPLLRGECDELWEAVDGGNLVEIMLEAADTANMALIIASIATERGNDRQGSENKVYEEGRALSPYPVYTKKPRRDVDEGG